MVSKDVAIVTGANAGIGLFPLALCPAAACKVLSHYNILQKAVAQVRKSQQG